MTLSGALIATVPGDGEVIFLQASGGGRVTHTVSVFVDLRQGGIAKHIALLEPIGVWVDEALRTRRRTGGGGRARAPARASERIVEAIRRTDECGDPILGETFVELRAFALARAGSPRRSGPDARLAELSVAGRRADVHDGCRWW